MHECFTQAGVSSRGQGFEAPPVEVPEAALALAMQTQRRALVAWMAARPAAELDAVLQTIIRTGLRTPTFRFRGWVHKCDEHQGLFAAPGSGVMMDVQHGEARSSVPADAEALESAAALHRTTVERGDSLRTRAARQACVLQQALSTTH